MDKISESEYRELLLVAEERRSSKGEGRRFTDREKRLFVQAYMAKQIAYDECKRVFNVSPHSINLWKRNFAAEDPLYWSSMHPEAAPTHGAPTHGASADYEENVLAELIRCSSRTPTLAELRPYRANREL